MTKSDSPCRINAVLAAEVMINNLGPTPAISATFALVNFETGQRMGQSKRNAEWSDETIRKLNEFLAALEQEAIANAFEEGNTTPSVGNEVDPARDGVPAL